MTSRSHLTACLVVCAAMGFAGTGAGIAAPQPMPQELWELYPLDPTGSGARQRPPGATAPETTTATTAAEAQPRGAVAGVRKTQQPRTVERGEGSGTPVAVGLMIGVAAAALILLALAALPPAPAFGRIGELAAGRRIDLLLAGVFALLIVTAVYVAGY
jgi:hypothetical protein